jgi:hypothetical protein
VPAQPAVWPAVVAQHRRTQFASAPESSYAARGAGSNLIWIDPEHDLAAVVRWIDKASMDGFIQLVLEAVQ